MASVNYLGRIQQVDIRTQATNKTTAQLLYSHNVDVVIIDIYLWCLHSKYLTSTIDVSQNLQRVTVVTDNFITLF